MLLQQYWGSHKTLDSLVCPPPLSIITCDNQYYGCLLCVNTDLFISHYKIYHHSLQILLQLGNHKYRELRKLGVLCEIISRTSLWIFYLTLYSVFCKGIINGFHFTRFAYMLMVCKETVEDKTEFIRTLWFG